MVSRDQFLTLFLQYQSELQAFIGSLILDRYLRDDVFQEVALTLFLSFVFSFRVTRELPPMPSAVCERVIWNGLFVVAIALCGCSGGDDKTVVATGTVVLDDQPVEGAIVTFASNGSEGIYNSYTDSSGWFSMDLSASVKGVPPGEYRVTVRSVSDLIPGGGSIGPPGSTMGAVQAPRPIPAKYVDSKTSQLVATVKRGQKNAYEFKLLSQ
jgi:hypothetical protein